MVQRLGVYDGSTKHVEGLLPLIGAHERIYMRLLSLEACQSND